MLNHFSQFLLAFLEGFALIISPCILPILPIVLSGSLSGRGLAKPVGVVCGFILSFTLFTFFSRKLVQWFGVDVGIIRDISLVLLVLFGLIMLSNKLSEKFEWLTERFASVGVVGKQVSRFEFINGLSFGALIGLIWTPCAGPILAAVIVQTVLQASDVAGLLLVFSFGLGAGVPMLLIAVFGKSILNRLHWIKRHAVAIRKTLGALIVVSVVYIVYGTFPMATDYAIKPETLRVNRLVNGLLLPYPAPEFVDIAQWINSSPLTITSLRGKVVLVDFWTYSCINCVRTLPYLKSWDRDYHQDGFVIVGVHSPEFAFESNPQNVENAVKKYGIRHPVALDNQLKTWTNYNNHYWPAHYLIDQEGRVVYQHFGEGNYDITENNIRFLLGKNKSIPGKPQSRQDWAIQTPETYLGYERMARFASLEPVARNAVSEYHYPPSLLVDTWALSGSWTVKADAIDNASAPAGIKLHFLGKKVFAVMGASGDEAIQVQLRVNGKVQSPVWVKQHDLYPLVSLTEGNEGELEMTIEQPGMSIFTFTFGE